MENIENKAEYSADSKGITLSSANANKNNPLGASASVGIPMQGEAGSTTYAAIADGIIKVAGKETQEQINHDTEHALNQLGEIFNRKDVEERQELAGLVSKEGFTLIGDLAFSKRKDLLLKAAEAKNAGNAELVQQYLKEADKWEDGGEYKVLLHSALGAVLSSMSGGSIASGALGAGANEALQKELGNIDNPELHKLASALIGGLAGNSSAKTGAAIAMSGTEYNFIPHEDQQYFLKDIEAFYKGNITREQFIDKLKYYVALDLYYTHIGNSDNISGDLKDGGNWFIASQLDRNSLTDIFAGEGIGTTSGFSTALYEFAKMYGVAYEYSPEIAEIIDTRIAPFRGTYVPKSESDIGGLVQSGVSQPTVVWEGYQAPDGRVFVIMSDDTVQFTGEKVNVSYNSQGDSYNLAESFLENAVTTKADFLPQAIEKAGYGGKELRILNKGGTIGTLITINDIYKDMQNYEGKEAIIQSGSELFPYVGGIYGGILGGKIGAELGSTVGGVPGGVAGTIAGATAGGIAGGMSGDYLQYFIIKKYHEVTTSNSENKKDEKNDYPQY